MAVPRRVRLRAVVLSVIVVLLTPPGSSAAGVPDPGDPHGLGGFFDIHCLYDHAAMDDPIVFRRRPGASHLHDFFGSRGVTASSTPRSLRAHGTTCGVADDLAGYWTPAPKFAGVVERPEFQNEYWFDGGFRHVQPVPFGLELVAGDARATRPQPTSHVFYYCGETPVDTPHAAVPYDCSRSPDTRTHDIIMVVVFPQCWDGVLARGNAAAHFAYPSAPGRCPPGFPHAVPRLEEHIHTGVSNPRGPHGRMLFALASGPYFTLHGDFMNAWRPAALLRFVDRCINAHVRCRMNRSSP